MGHLLQPVWEVADKLVQALTLCFARETVTIVDNLGLTRAQRESVEDTITAIQQYVDGQVNESVERCNFHRRVQQTGETFDDFLVSLRELVKTCKFCSEDCLRKNIRDQIIEGHLVGDTVEELLRERDLSLETTISKCRAKKQRAEISPGVDSVQVHIVKQQQHLDRSSNQQQRYPNRTSNQQQRYSDHTSNWSPRWCAGCGSAPHPGGRPAFCCICHNCKIVGHLARVCRKPTYGTSPTSPLQRPWDNGCPV